MSQSLLVPFSADLSVVKWETITKKAGDPDQLEKKKQEHWFVEGYAATDDIDSEDDRIDIAALQEGAENLKSYQTCLYNHDKDRPIGSIQDVKVLPEGQIWVKIKISKTEPKIWEQIQDGTLNKFSVRGKIYSVDREFSATLNRYIRVIKSLKLFECSIVSVPANPEARTLRWYISKALTDYFTEQGGNLPAGEGTDSSGGQSMKTKDEETLQAAGTPSDDVEKTEGAAASEDTTPDESTDQDTPTEDAPTEDAPEEDKEEEEEQEEEAVEDAAPEAVKFFVPFADDVKKSFSDAIAHIDKLTVNASEEQQAILKSAKNVMERLVNEGHEFSDIALTNEGLSKKIVDARLEAMKSAGVSEVSLLISHAEEVETDPVRKHFLKGVKMVLGIDDEVTKDADGEQPEGTDVKKTETPSVDGVLAKLSDTVTQIADKVEGLGKRIDAMEAVKSTPDEEDDTTETEVEEAEETPAEETDSEDETPVEDTKDETAEATIKALGGQLDQIVKTLSGLSSRIEKVEKTEGVSQVIPGQDSQVEQSSAGGNAWANVFAPGIAQAIGARQPK